MVKLILNYYDNLSYRNKNNQTDFDLTNNESII